MPEGGKYRLGRATRRGVDLHALEVFVRVCETGNMTSAGSILGMTQSAVSHVIKNIEDQVGVTLFDRTMRPVVITAAGNILRQHAQRLLQEAEQMIGLVRNSGATVVPHVGLGIVSSFAVSVGPNLVSKIYGKAAEISIFSGSAPMLRKAFVRREADIIITSERLNDLDHVDMRPLLQEPYLLVMSTRSAERYGDCSLQELGRVFPLIRYSASTSVGSQIERHLRRIRVETVSSLEMDTSEAILAMVLNDLGWTITTPLALLRSAIHAADLRVNAFPPPGFSRSLSVVSRRGELAGLPQEIAELSRDLLRHDVIPTLERQYPNITEQMRVD